MPVALFWLAWGMISFWALKTFYYSFAKEKLERLRKAALGISLAVLILNIGMTPRLPGIFILLLITAIALYTTHNHVFLRIATIATIINTLWLFFIMFSLRPGTFSLTGSDAAPIFAALLLLTNTVAGLLLWQQLDLITKRRA